MLLCSSGVCLAVGMSVSKDMMEVVTYSGSDTPLQCTARYKPGVQYRAVRWYKVKINLFHGVFMKAAAHIRS